MTLAAAAAGGLLQLRRVCALQAHSCPRLRCRPSYIAGPSREAKRLPHTFCESQRHRTYSSSAGADISSTSNEYVKHCCKLRTSLKYRQASGKVLVVGNRLVEEVFCNSDALNLVHVHTMLLAHEAQPPSGVQADRTCTVTDSVLKKVCGLENTAGVQVVAEVDIPQQANLSKAHTKVHRLLALEGLQDPGNLGTLLRTAVAFGWDACFLLPGCCDPFNDKALKAGRGAAFKLPMTHGNWHELEAILQKQQMQCLGACPDRNKQGNAGLDWDLTAESRQSAVQTESSSSQVEPSQAVCLVLGAEGQGLSNEAMQHIKPVGIPMPGPMESLNVSQAGAILMFALSNAGQQLLQKLQ